MEMENEEDSSVPSSVWRKKHQHHHHDKLSQQNSSADTPVTKPGVANFIDDENNDEQKNMIQFFGGHCQIQKWEKCCSTY
jgi:hypothetical protein